MTTWSGLWNNSEGVSCISLHCDIVKIVSSLEDKVNCGVVYGNFEPNVRTLWIKSVKKKKHLPKTKALLIMLP